MDLPCEGTHRRGGNMQSARPGGEGVHLRHRLDSDMSLFRSLVPLLACVSVAQAQIPAFAATSRVPPAKGEQIAVLAGGCFWGVDAVFKHVKEIGRASCRERV